MFRFVPALAMLLICQSIHALEGMTLRAAIEQAANNNPGVLAAWNAFEASNEGVRAARGGYFPRLDFIAEKGKEDVTDPQDIEQSFDTSSYRLTLTQMLFDGFATKHEVDRQHYIKLSRYYEFRQASEDMALETAQAYLDVVRFRKLVELAKQNYFQHLRYHRDIEERVNSGIGRGVDLEQARARLALAESNVLTETTNLHDVSVRFQRLVGIFPATNMHSPAIPSAIIPAQRKDALLRAMASNPQLNAAIENIRTNRADMKGRNAPMMPRLDLRLRKEVDDNMRGFDGKFEEQAVELVMTYNLYNGGSDSARKRQSRYLMLEARDTRDRVCREVRQTVSIAYNDISSRAALVGYLEKNEEAISNAREAYKNQFDIGQRTLLDLLDTENEYFEVKRTLTNAKSEQQLAELRTLAGMGLLLHALNINGADESILDDLDLSREEALNARCPAEAPQMGTLDFDTSKILAPRDIPLSSREVMRLDIKFNHQSDQITSGSSDEIERAATFLCSHAGIKGVVEGHTDSSGSDQYNLRLSQARANAVRIALLNACPDAQGRLSSVGFGETRPIAQNDTELGRATNRRVELVLEGGVTEVDDMFDSMDDSGLLDGASILGDEASKISERTLDVKAPFSR